MMQLKDTVGMMLSKDYVERFKAEYYQTKIRYQRLGDLLKKQAEGQLIFEPKSSLANLNLQFTYMGLYLLVLKARAAEEGIVLEDDD